MSGSTTTLFRAAPVRDKIGRPTLIHSEIDHNALRIRHLVNQTAGNSPITLAAEEGAAQGAAAPLMPEQPKQGNLEQEQLDNQAHTTRSGSMTGNPDDLPDFEELRLTVDTIIERLQTETDKSKIPDLIDKLIDALYLSLSMLDYTQHIINQNSAQAASEHFNNFISSTYKHPEDLLITLSTMVFMVSFALFASNWMNNKLAQKAYKYVRLILSGLKNGRHAVVNLFFLLSPLTSSAYHVFNPIGIAVGIALAPALILYYYLDNERNKMIDANYAIIDNLIRYHEFNEDSGLTNWDISPQMRSKWVDGAMMGLAVFDGLTDGAYMFGAAVQALGGYAGFAGLCAVTGGTAAIAFLSTIAIYTLLSIVSSIFIEYDRQQKLRKSADEVNIIKLSICKAKTPEKLTALESNLRKQYNIKNSEHDIIDYLTKRYEKKYNVKMGETASRTRLTVKMETFEKLIVKLTGIETKSKEQRYFNAFLTVEHEFKNTYKLNGQKIDLNLLSKAIELLDNYKNALHTARQTLRERPIEQHVTPMGLAYCALSDPRIVEIKKQKQQVEAQQEKVNSIRKILLYKQRSGIETNLLQETILRYKTYTTELIAGEKKLYRIYRLTSDTAQTRLTNVDTLLKTYSEKINPYHYYMRAKLNKEKHEIIALQEIYNKTTFAKETASLLYRIKDLKSVANLESSDRIILDNVEHELCSNPSRSSTNLAAQQDTSSITSNLANLESKYYPQKSENHTAFIDAHTCFDDTHKKQKIHLTDYSLKAPQAKGWFNTGWRSVRGYLSGFKNDNKLIDSALKSPMTHASSFLGTKLLKFALVPTAAAYGQYVAKKEYKRHAPKPRARGPRLFDGLRTDPNRRYDDYGSEVQQSSAMAAI